MAVSILRKQMTREQYEDWKRETIHAEHGPRERRNPSCDPCIDKHDCDDDSRCGGCVSCAALGRYDTCDFACEHAFTNYADQIRADAEVLA